MAPRLGNNAYFAFSEIVEKHVFGVFCSASLFRGKTGIYIIPREIMIYLQKCSDFGKAQVLRKRSDYLDPNFEGQGKYYKTNGI